MPRIIPGEPLPDHTKIDYNECYAKLVLEKVFSERYNNLIFSDRPDLRNQRNTIGIEVTSAIPEDVKESTKLWYQLESNTAKKPELNKERMKQLGVEYTGGVQAWPLTVYPTGNFDKSPYLDILKKLETKIKKLNSGKYDLLERYDLFIETELFVEEDFLPIILNRALKINTGKLQYSYLYVMFHNRICEFDLCNKSFQIRMFTEQFEVACEARSIIEKAENVDDPLIAL